MTDELNYGELRFVHKTEQAESWLPTLASMLWMYYSALCKIGFDEELASDLLRDFQMVLCTPRETGAE